jgi:hypothetical protein
LDHAHAAILAKLNGLDEFANKSSPLAITRFVGREEGRKRFPTASIAVTSSQLPPVPFRPDHQMLIELPEPLDKPSKGWLFFVRNPDTRFRLADPGSSSGIPNRIWNQKPADIIRWCASPFSIPLGFFGPLPGFPCAVSALEGEFTAYLLIEEETAQGVLRQLQIEMGRTWDPAAPTFEPTLHLIARAQTLFQKGNKAKGVDYAPPTLLVRRYRVTKG